jgi:hypothetical protein
MIGVQFFIKIKNYMEDLKMKRVLSFIIVTFFLCSLSSASNAFADTKTLIIKKDDLLSADATQFSLYFNIGGAHINITRSDDADTIVKAVVTYDSGISEPTLTTTSYDGNLTAKFSSEYEWEYSWPITIQEWEITIGSYNIDTDVSMACGGVMADIDLGGLPLRKCTLSLGGVDMDIDFSTTTTRQLEKLKIYGGGALLSMSNIGNTDFKKFEINGGGNVVDLDFKGAYVSEQHDVDIITAGGVQTIAVPSDAGEQVQITSVASPVVVQGSGWNKEIRPLFKHFITNDYDAQNVKIDIDMIAVGSLVTVIRN